MGYYLHVTCRSVRERDAMLSFLREHLRPVPDLMPWTHPAHTDIGPPDLGKTVCAYAKNKLDVGYYASAGWDEEAREFADNLLRWVALKVGQTRPFSLPGLDVATDLPFTLYESEARAVVVQAQFPTVPDHWGEDVPYERCDEVGWDPSFRPLSPDIAIEPGHYLYEIRQRKEKAAPIIREELLRLDALWASR